MVVLPLDQLLFRMCTIQKESSDILLLVHLLTGLEMPSIVINLLIAVANINSPTTRPGVLEAILMLMET